jgi:hypothetical protein
MKAVVAYLASAVLDLTARISLHSPDNRGLRPNILRDLAEDALQRQRPAARLSGI